jgi:hypothetical protein
MAMKVFNKSTSRLGIMARPFITIADVYHKIHSLD